MKKQFIATIAIALIAMVYGNKVMAEETAELDPMMFEYGYNAPDSTQAQEQQSVVLVDNSALSSDDVPGRGMRRVGQIMTGAGVTMAAAFGIYTSYLVNKDDDDFGEAIGDTFGVVITTGATAINVAAAVVGVVLWTKGQHKMNRFKASSEGLGLAYTF